MTFDTRILLLLACVGVTAMCGGKAVIDAEGGPGSGGAGPGPTTTGPTGPSPTTTGAGPGVCVDDTNGESRAMAGDCQAACEILFCCAVPECPGIDADNKNGFVNGCVNNCEQQQAVIAVVNGEDCEGTVSVISSASQQFNDSCENGN